MKLELKVKLPLIGWMKMAQHFFSRPCVMLCNPVEESRKKMLLIILVGVYSLHTYIY